MAKRSHDDLVTLHGDAEPVADPAIVLTGMRGAGKTHLGRAFAKAFGWPFIDLDDVYETRYGKIMETVAKEGWPVFRQREAAILAEELAAHPTRAVLACGGGIVETAEGRARLRAHWPVVQALKQIEDVEAYLSYDKNRPSLGEPPRSVFARRSPWYDECADLDMLIAPGDSQWSPQEARFVGMLGRVLGHAPLPPPHEHSFMLSLTCDSYEGANLDRHIFDNVDLVEFRVDLLKSLAINDVRAQLAILRQQCRGLPLLFTVRSRAEGGAFEGTPEQYWQLCELGARSGCEYVDVESARDGPQLRAFCGRASRLGAAIIGSHHVTDRMPPLADIQEALRSCALGGAAAVAKFVGYATAPAHALDVQAAAATAGLSVPYIALAMGPLGRMSRVLNCRLTPVTHALLPAAAAPGQISASDILRMRSELSYLPSRSFHLFGKPVGQSCSHVIHAAGFGANGTAHTYTKIETDDVGEVLRAAAAAGFGGASVTIPLKEALLPHVAERSPSVVAIGGLNTLTRRPDGTLAADNTDWLAIRTLLGRGLATRPGAAPPPASLVALVVGAGGTARAACYALQQMGVGRICVHNRTAEKAAALAAAFGAHVCDDPVSLAQLDLVVSCVPGASGFTLPAPLLEGQRPVVLDAAYMPRHTPLLASARQAGCPTYEGIEMLFEQGCVQCEIWTHRAAPRRAIVQAMVEHLDQKGFGEVPFFSDILRGTAQ